jgi:hypothetical protein
LVITVSIWASPPPPIALRSMSTVLASVPVRSLTVDGVGAAGGVEADALDVVEVEHDVGDVAGEAHVPAVGGDVDRLVGAAAVEVEQVVSGLSLDDVAPVAGIPLEAVVAVAQRGPVVAVASGHDVVAGAAEKGLRSGAAEQRVCAGAAVDG